MIPVPVIRLEVEGMHHAISIALHEHQVKMDSDMQEALTKYCSPDNIKRVIDNTTQDALNRAITDEVDKFYRYGKGRTVIAEAVEKTLLEKI